MRGTPLLLAFALFLAGCTGNGDPSAKVDVPDAFQEPVEVADGKGVLRGIVITPAIVPVADAVVQIVSSGQNKTTDEDGAFVFADLEPGSYFIEVSKPGWTRVQQSAEVVADVAEPEAVKVIIEQLPGSQPRVETLRYEGYIGCSFGTPINYGGCGFATNQQDDAEAYFDVEGIPSVVQTEVLWDSTQPSGDWFYLVQGFCTCDGGVPDLPEDGGARFDELPDAQSGHTARANSTYLREFKVGEDPSVGQLVVSVSASGPEPDTTNGSGVALNQAFEVYATFFYNIPEPDPDWKFHVDGPYPVPTDTDG